MKIEIAQHARMSESGSSLLRLIQNDNMPMLDLLVRESVQNSLDAAKVGSGSVKMEFNIGEFHSSKLNRHLEGVADSLVHIYPDDMYKYLEIRDSNTVGLTGPLHHKYVINGEFGNLLKMVYEISMPQQQEGAGGSWGLGKTVYFRTGIGLVIYYSRIEDENGRYLSRLAACLIEDEKKPDTIIPSIRGNPKRGIAWWGQDAGDSTTKPLTNEKEINEILNSLGVSPYPEKGTGTSIIIPYINEKRLVDSILVANGDDAASVEHPWWTKSVPDYLRVAVQRWYAPRLENKNYNNGRWLSVSINGSRINAKDMLPLFKIVQGLYNRTPLSGGVSQAGDILSSIESLLESKPIFLKKTFKDSGISGYLSYCKLSSSQLLMTPPNNNPNPYVQINESGHDFNYPIIMYVRKPGMVVGYETLGKWTDGIPKTTNDEYIIGLFVADSNNIVGVNGNSITLNEYLRKSEKADHASWTDWNSTTSRNTIITRIQKQVSRHISDRYSVQENGHLPPQVNRGLGRALAVKLLPPEDFGSGPSPGPGGPGNGHPGHAGKSFSIKLNDKAIYDQDMMKIDFELYCGEKYDNFLLDLHVLSEASPIDANVWEKDDVIGKPFPIKLEKIQITKVKTGRPTPGYYPNSFVLDAGSKQVKFYNITINSLTTIRYGITYGVKIILPDTSGYTLNGSAYLSGNSEKVRGSLMLIQDEGI